MDTTIPILKAKNTRKGVVLLLVPRLATTAVNVGKLIVNIVKKFMLGVVGISLHHKMIQNL